MKARIALSSKQKKSMNSEITRQIAENERKHMLELDAIILWVLHEQLGFGEKRLRRFYDRFSDIVEKLLKHYDLDDADDAWVCTRKLKDIGINIEEWSKENEYI